MENLRLFILASKMTHVYPWVIRSIKKIYPDQENRDPISRIIYDREYQIPLELKNDRVNQAMSTSVRQVNQTKTGLTAANNQQIIERRIMREDLVNMAGLDWHKRLRAAAMFPYFNTISVSERVGILVSNIIQPAGIEEARNTAGRSNNDNNDDFDADVRRKAREASLFALAEMCKFSLRYRLDKSDIVRTDIAAQLNRDLLGQRPTLEQKSLLMENEHFLGHSKAWGLLENLRLFILASKDAKMSVPFWIKDSIRWLYPNQGPGDPISRMIYWDISFDQKSGQLVFHNNEGIGKGIVFKVRSPTAEEMPILEKGKNRSNTNGASVWLIVKNEASVKNKVYGVETPGNIFIREDIIPEQQELTDQGIIEEALRNAQGGPLRTLFLRLAERDNRIAEDNGWRGRDLDKKIISIQDIRYAHNKTFRSKDDLIKYIEEPWLEAVRLLWDKGIFTVSSSANMRDILNRFGYVKLNYDKLSANNKVIAGRYGHIASSGTMQTVSFIISIPDQMTVGEFNAKALELAHRFENQNDLAVSSRYMPVAEENIPGGIDLTADKTPLEARNAGEGIKFNIDPAMLQRLRNAPGFTPVIINIHPLADLRSFLDLSASAPKAQNPLSS